jgi:exosortase A-associated hydrolase 1
MTPLTFGCDGATLAGMLHPAGGPTGVVIVSGGVQTRAGPHGSQTALAAHLADTGYPALRFDRRGVGDSDGDDPGFTDSGPDIAAAVAALRAAAPAVRKVVGIGLCDAASALALHGRAAGCDGLVLVNPWTRDHDDPGLPPRAAVAARYRSRMFSPAAWSRLLRSPETRGAVARGLRRLARPEPESALFAAMRARAADLPTLVILADGDATAQAFAAAAKGGFGTARIARLPANSHSFAREGESEMLFDTVRDWLAVFTSGETA